MRTNTELPSLEGATEWLNGPPPAREELKGGVILVHFWAVSCGLCKDTLPAVNEWRESYRERGLKIIGIHMPRSESDTEPSPVRQAVQDYGLTHPNAIDNMHAIVDAFQNQYVPVFYLFDRDLKLRHFQAGDRGLTMIQAALERAL
ncbi:MAG: redoxin domain-containing protein [Armatimonadetes bacterium]|nr:redoxin domain-containing protein [Armatimonadota bacterium]